MKRYATTWCLGVILLILSVVSLFLGVIDLRTEHLDVLFISRLPRLLAILCTGVGMSVAGLIMQQLCRNRFVSPTTGATISCSQLGILLALLYFPSSTLWSRAVFAFAAAIAGTCDLQCKKATSIRKINGIPICRKHRREEPVLNL